MPDVVVVFFKWFGVFGLACTLVNAVIIKHRSRKLVEQNLDLEEVYKKLFRGYLIFFSLPWLILTVGVVTGGLPYMWYIFRPRGGNPYVLLFHFTVIVMWILSFIWVYFKDGAEFVVKYWYPLQPRRRTGLLKSSLGFKVTFALCLLGGVIGMAMMWLIDFPFPDF